MKWAVPGIEYTILRSKVARRIFLLFTLCALLPLCIHAVISIYKVRNDLNRRMDQQLRQESKSEAMAVFERLAFLETDLDFVLLNLSHEYSDTLDPAVRSYREHIDARFRSLALSGQDGRIVDHYGPEPKLPELNDKEKRHLIQDKPLFTSRLNSDGTADMFLAVTRNPGTEGPEILFGEIRPEFIWGGDRFIAPDAVICAFNDEEALLFSSVADKAPLQELKNARSEARQSGWFQWNDGRETYLAGYWTLFLRPTFFNSVVLVHSGKKDQVMAPIYNFTRDFLLIMLLTFWVVLFLSLNHIRKRTGPIEQLRDATRKIMAKDFAGRVRIKSNDEFEELGASFNDMADSLQNYISVMDRINRIGISLSAEEDNDRLLEMVLTGAKKAVHAEGAALYLLSDDSKMELARMHIPSLGLRIEKSNRQNLKLYQIMKTFPSPFIADNRTVHVEDIYAADGSESTCYRIFDENTGYRTRSLLSVPLINHEKEIIGILQIINAKDRKSDHIVGFTEEDRKLVESLASQAAVTLVKNRLVQEFKVLFEDLTELIGTAIDEKSPYTGGHCKRVPVLTLMLAEAVSQSDTGPFKNFSLSPDEEYELKIAAMLHDCGKVTTPVHIVDKATKLETIVDRIELIQARFEILKRDKQVELLRETLVSRVDNPDVLSAIDKETADFTRQLKDDLEFLEKCNVGSESMPVDFQYKIRKIAGRYTWETSEGSRKPLLTKDEAYNLCIRSGTLTPEERKIINDHILTSVRMLKSLKYPKNLRNVPVHAGAHHERFDGKGYPAGLAGDQISIQGRILAIADVFEALTAADRPYHKTNTLSEALGILRTMKDKGQIDPDLYDTFIKEKVYLQYARQFLKRDQIDLDLDG
ncbi:MAG: GAF domain-containing protein [Acidobacteria bacterium]|nr:GAF domain-containing protein [Acidobacteriota bacterium]